MRMHGWISVSLLAGAMFAAVHLSASAALAQTGAVLVVPGMRGVPVMINGRDASWAVVEGDWGLARSIPPNPTIIYRVGPEALIGPAPSRYYPATGNAPAYGRHEVIPPADRSMPKPAESFYREWGTQSDPGPETTYPPFAPPAVVVAPQHRSQKPPKP
jgi:hypothetical protein